ncbi:hypothetical protein [Chryseobacterium carnipullorum]|uniref:hypothetical protein n=1 Tax=Chryseobacterium carnipullorum TaxID=1124835 RepID=UPI0023F42CF7|nr:hypothetical protein [Chryseobacterium carnipullorum]
MAFLNAGYKEKEIYWFHPDHLGSSSYITGLDGEVTQNIEYFPSGEVFVENHNKQVITAHTNLMARNLMLKQGITIMELDIIIQEFLFG